MLKYKKRRPLDSILLWLRSNLTTPSHCNKHYYFSHIVSSDSHRNINLFPFQTRRKTTFHANNHLLGIVMLAAVSPLENSKSIDGRDEMVRFSDDNLLESIDFDDLFEGMDMLPELLAGGEDSWDSFSGDQKVEDLTSRKEGHVSKQDEAVATRLKSSHDKCKRKVKVDWTPELHRRFVQAVEQLGVDKAVPSRILEIMGIASLTRHNIASHLQKYRSHRKHMLAREAEAASWSQRRQMYGGTKALVASGGGGKRDMGPWVAPPPTMGFPPTTPIPHYRPFHVWGHPSIDRPLMHVWPKHIAHSRSPPPPSMHVWPPSASPPPTWHPPHQRAPYFPQILPQTRFPSPHAPVPGIPPSHAMYKTDSATHSTTQSFPQPPLDLHPSKESIDAAIGDILSQPWQPLPLGLKPPAVDSVMVELQRQGIQKIPPTCI